MEDHNWCLQAGRFLSPSPSPSTTSPRPIPPSPPLLPYHPPLLPPVFPLLVRYSGKRYVYFTFVLLVIVLFVPLICSSFQLSVLLICTGKLFQPVLWNRVFCNCIRCSTNLFFLSVQCTVSNVLLIYFDLCYVRVTVFVAFIHYHVV